ncbi:MAG: Uma2 family endonuclease [Anaerolineae bacterium]|nr:Uma2 family endonuclease [Anaerolineae bacterium]
MVTVEMPIIVNATGKIIAFDVPEDVYMRDYAEDFCEWIDGTVIKMSPVHEKHDRLTRYLTRLIEAYLELRPIGDVRQEPFVMRYEYEQEGKKKRRSREPDIQVILGENQKNLQKTYMDGAANIVIEVVSLESAARDYGEKFHEYEQADVPEYWIIDSIKEECRFYLLNDKKTFVPQEFEDEYAVAQMSDLKIHVPTLWQENLPGPGATFKSVAKMLEGD